MVTLEGTGLFGKVSEASVPPWWNVIWPALQEPPDAWRLQRLDSGGGNMLQHRIAMLHPSHALSAGWAGGIPQPKNGPCGVIAVVHALVLAKQYKRPTDQIQATGHLVDFTKDPFWLWAGVSMAANGCRFVS